MTLTKESSYPLDWSAFNKGECFFNSRNTLPIRVLLKQNDPFSMANIFASHDVTGMSLGFQET